MHLFYIYNFHFITFISLFWFILLNQFFNFDEKVVTRKRLLKLDELEEMCLYAYENTLINNERTKRYHEKKLVAWNFQPDQQVLLFNSEFRLFPRKLKSKWFGPFIVTEVYHRGAIEIQDLGYTHKFKVNGKRLKHYFGGDLPNEKSQSDTF